MVSGICSTTPPPISRRSRRWRSGSIRSCSPISTRRRLWTRSPGASRRSRYRERSGSSRKAESRKTWQARRQSHEFRCKSRLPRRCPRGCPAMTALVAHARIALADPDAVIAPLCEHLVEHGAEITQEEGATIIALGSYRGRLQSSDGHLVVRAEAPDLASLQG